MNKVIQLTSSFLNGLKSNVEKFNNSIDKRHLDNKILWVVVPIFFGLLCLNIIFLTSRLRRRVSRGDNLRRGSGVINVENYIVNPILIKYSAEIKAFLKLKPFFKNKSDWTEVDFKDKNSALYKLWTFMVQDSWRKNADAHNVNWNDFNIEGASLDELRILCSHCVIAESSINGCFITMANDGIFYKWLTRLENLSKYGL